MKPFLVGHHHLIKFHENWVVFPIPNSIESLIDLIIGGFCIIVVSRSEEVVNQKGEISLLL